MQGSSGHDLVVKLSSLLRLHGDAILQRESKLCLTASSLAFLNQCFGDLTLGQQGNSALANGHSSQVTDLISEDVRFLLDFFGTAPSLKLVQRVSFRFDGWVSVSCFRALQILEIKKVPVGLIKGFQSLRPQLKTLICHKSLVSLNEVFVHCGRDQVAAPFSWPRLESGDFSYNGIEQLDDSLKLLPALKMLNLSHNSIRTADSNSNWQYLSGIRHLNIGFNQLDCIPVIPAEVGVVTFQVTTLIIRNNNLQNLEGLQVFKNLYTLDVSFNCLTSFSELTPLALLHNLTLLYLQGNPVVFDPEYRINTVAFLYPVPRREMIKIDGKALNPAEQIYLGRNVHPVSLLSYISERSPAHPRVREVSRATDDGTQDSSESQDDPESGPRRRRPKRRNKKGRRVLAREIDFDAENENETTTTTEETTVTSAPIEQILEYADDVEQLKKLRQMGGEAWLPAIDSIVHKESHATVTDENKPEQGRTVFRTESLQSFSADDKMEITSHASSLSVVTLLDEDITDEHCFLVTLLETGQEDEGNQTPLFVTIKEDFIIEKNYAGKVICQLETSRVKHVHVEKAADGANPVTSVMFDYINRERQMRHYVMETQEAALQLAELLKPCVMANAQAKLASFEHLQCLKCSAEFRRPEKSDDQACPECGSTMIVFIGKSTSAVDERDGSADETLGASVLLNNSSIKTIDSGMSVTVLVPFSSSTCVDSDNQDQSEEKEKGLLGSTVLEKNKSHLQAKAAYVSQSPDVVAHTQQISEESQPVPDSCTNTSEKEPGKHAVDPSSRNESNQKRYVARNHSRFVVNDRDGTFITKKQSPVRTSALSNSLKEGPSKVAQVRQEMPSNSLPMNGDISSASKIFTRGRTVVDTRDSLVSTPPISESRGSPARVELLSQSLPDHSTNGILSESGAASIRKLSAQPKDRGISPSQRITDAAVDVNGVSKQHQQWSFSTNHGKISDSVTPRSVPDQPKLSSSLSSTPKLFQNLLNRFSGKMSGPSSASSLDSPSQSSSSSRASTPSIMEKVVLSFRLPPDEFSSCDHRLKLFFEVSLFEEGHRETFCCLLKAPVVPYGSKKETPAVMVISNTMLYICRFTLAGSGTPDECLTKLVSYPLDDLQYIDQGLGSQSFRLEFSSVGACYEFFVRDKDRCEKFLKLFVDCVQETKARNGGKPVVVTPPNPQTLEHIRSQVFGVRVEDPVSLCHRIHQQAMYFTDPPLIKDRKSLLRNYSSCFVGKEFVNWLLRTREVGARDEAVALGQRLLDAGLLEQVSKEHLFEDKDHYYRFIGPDSKLERIDSPGKFEEEFAEESLPDLDTNIVLFIMAHHCTSTRRPDYNLTAVSVIVSRTHFAIAYQNPQWPIPRFTEPPVSMNVRAFACLAKHKITDITSLDFYEDAPCFVGVVITDEYVNLENKLRKLMQKIGMIKQVDKDAPVECADSQWILRTESFTTLSSLVKAIKEPWETQFGVELQKNLYPSITEDKF